MILALIGLQLLQILNFMAEGQNSQCTGKGGRDVEHCPASSITNDELIAIGQQIWDSDEDRLNVGLNLQGRASANHADKASAPVCRDVPKEIHSLPVYTSLTSLFDNYVQDDSKKEEITSAEWTEVDAFLGTIMRSGPMKVAHEFLASKGLVPERMPDFQKVFKEIWYHLYKRSKALSSSGAEHVLIGEIKAGKVSGLHNWVRFCSLEEKGVINYLGYDKALDLGGAYLLQAPFLWDNHLKPIGGFFVGTSPAFDLSVFTVCFYARPNGKCKLKLNGHSVKIQTHTNAYNGKTLVGSAYPEI